MRFYRSKGRVWTGTQADAREAQGSNGYETIDVPTDKPTLLGWLNTFVLRPAEQGSTNSEMLTGADPDGSVERPAPPVSAEETITGADKRKPQIVDWQSRPEPGDCKRCDAMSTAARSIETIMALTNIEHAISYADEAVLSRIEQVIAGRRVELGSGLAPQAPARVRQRVRVQPVASEEVAA